MLRKAIAYSTVGAIAMTNDHLCRKYAFRGSFPAFGAAGELYYRSKKTGSKDYPLTHEK